MGLAVFGWRGQSLSLRSFPSNSERFCINLGPLLMGSSIKLPSLTPGRTLPQLRRTCNPIFPKRREYAKKAPAKIAPLADKRKDIIKSVQPYNAPKLKPEQIVFKAIAVFAF